MAYRRAPNATQINLSVNNDALALLRLHAGSQRTIGQFVARLVFEFHARQEERQRLAARLTDVAHEVCAAP